MDQYVVVISKVYDWPNVKSIPITCIVQNIKYSVQVDVRIVFIYLIIIPRRNKIIKKEEQTLENNILKSCSKSKSLYRFSS